MLLFCTPMLFAGVHKDDANGDLPMKAAEPESSTQAERLVDQIAASVLSGEFQPGPDIDEAPLNALRHAHR